MRTFVALPATSLSEPLAAVLDEYRNLPLRWTPWQNWHLTLRFLGDTDAARIPALGALLQTVARRPPSTIQLRALRWFPSERRRIALAVTVADDVRLTEMQSKLERGVVDLGFAPEARRFRPHVTVARAPRRRKAPAFAEVPLELELPVTELVLYESVATREGVRYAALTRAALGAGGGTNDFRPTV